jgi:sRNA-binding regulator protein Hfq
MNMRKIAVLIILAGLLFFFAFHALAATVILKNGNSISGRIEKEDRRSVTLRFNDGRMVIKKCYISSVVKTEEDLIREGLRIETPKIDFTYIERTLDLEMARLRAERQKTATVTPNPDNPPANASVENSGAYVPALGAEAVLPQISAALRLPAGWAFEWNDGVYNIWLDSPKEPALKNKFRGSIARLQTPPMNRGQQVEMSLAALNAGREDRLKSSLSSPRSIENSTGTPRPSVILLECLVKEKAGDETIQQYLIWIGDYTYIVTFTYPAPKEDVKNTFHSVFDESAISLRAAN